MSLICNCNLFCAELVTWICVELVSVLPISWTVWSGTLPPVEPAVPPDDGKVFVLPISWAVRSGNLPPVQPAVPTRSADIQFPR